MRRIRAIAPLIPPLKSLPLPTPSKFKLLRLRFQAEPGNDILDALHPVSVYSPITTLAFIFSLQTIQVFFYRKFQLT